MKLKERTTRMLVSSMLSVCMAFSVMPNVENNTFLRYYFDDKVKYGIAKAHEQKHTISSR